MLRDEDDQDHYFNATSRLSRENAELRDELAAAIQERNFEAEQGKRHWETLNELLTQHCELEAKRAQAVAESASFLAALKQEPKACKCGYDVCCSECCCREWLKTELSALDAAPLAAEHLAADRTMAERVGALETAIHEARRWMYRTDPPGSWSALCGCGWNGPQRETHSEAEKDLEQHYTAALAPPQARAEGQEAE